MKPHQGDNRSGDIAQHSQMRRDRLPDPGGGRPEHNKDGAEPGHKKQCRQHDRKARRVTAIRPQFIHRNPAHVGKIRRHQRKHTRRGKGQQPGHKSPAHADVKIHSGPAPNTFIRCYIFGIEIALRTSVTELKPATAANGE